MRELHSLFRGLRDVLFGVAAAPAEVAKATLVAVAETPAAIVQAAKPAALAFREDHYRGGRASAEAVSSFKAFERRYGAEVQEHVRSSYRGKDSFVDAGPSRGRIGPDGVSYSEDYSEDFKPK